MDYRDTTEVAARSLETAFASLTDAFLTGLAGYTLVSPIATSGPARRMAARKIATTRPMPIGLLPYCPSSARNPALDSLTDYISPQMQRVDRFGPMCTYSRCPCVNPFNLLLQEACEPAACAPSASVRVGCGLHSFAASRLGACLGFNGASSRWAAAALTPQR